MDIRDSTAVVTGAASGLGAATAAELVARGARVIGLDLPQVVHAAAPVDGVQYVSADVTDEEQVRAAVVTAADVAPLRTVVNCAGIGTSARVVGKNGVHDIALFERVVRINLVGTFTVLALAAEVMTAQDPVDEAGQRGVIINTASVAAFEGQIGQAAYAASKGGVHSMTIAAARDLSSRGVRVMTIAPGIVDTPMLGRVSEDFRSALAESVPFPRRLARPDEYAQLAGMIVEHDYLNGETIRMDGALRMAPR
ncbi:MULTISPECIES: SDR family NAD(P)-dependent oxidoreductase [Kocuria]|uniref:NAD(P)-dependent dehydrogenase, short-chain alcohol dehydrogenase family n=1 Tax=Kocuria marina subsp. indica TaxID=1049583 RepID=A0A1X7D104_9MICC|nr:SDR family NAD(P)-dependent oxidoreductase [Kocuria indica]MCG7430967.1 SDR family NAD(P)-dependent oxidoreductase [Kocuria indica]OXS83845.1 3-hydroxyacyl-CoA dehydrogenase [Kocuria indica]QBJ20563.1 SDR family NAD(P)-dependent oxidoreductase [Kocuria indica]RLP58038.1 SDR family NAD(P)-dependent oxidoreductase [Kocuria indica]SMF06655.1 NAD(P)-dependent dehydrogenase, short-chain alcohol dehydrogenase family [Kocuria indica]